MKIAIITGASVGIGRQTASRFLGEGFRVFNLSRRTCSLEGVQNITCDLSIPASITEACQKLSTKTAGADCICLIHNASQMRKDSANDCDSDALREVLETNIVAVNSLNQALVPQMPASSSVIYIGSTLSQKAVPGSFSYVVSKHAQLGAMRATCQDMMGSGIHTALVCPGFTDTEMLRTHIGTNPEIEQSIASMNSFNRLISPDEIAELVFWATQNPVINGAVLHANLGQKES